MPEKIPFVDLTTQFENLRDEIVPAVVDVMERSDFILGDQVELFETEFAGFCGAARGLGVASGTDALHLALRACDVGLGDEVITAANTFAATVLAITFCDARPVLVDVHPDLYTLDPALVEAAITPRTKAIVPVHLYGQCADMDPILDVARRHGVSMVEDACQAHGADYKGRRAGILGDIAAFSFYPGKNLGAYGDGGLITTDSDDLAERVRMLRNYGQRVKYHHDQIGFNSRLDTVQAAVLRIKLRRLSEWNDARRAAASEYREALAGVSLDLPPEADYGRHVYHLFVVRCERRDALREACETDGISVGIHYPIPVHLQKAFADLGYEHGSFPVTEKLAGEILSLPMFPEITNEQIGRVCLVLRENSERKTIGETFGERSV